MDKEKILEASRAEKSDERELQVKHQAGAIAMWVGALMCMLITIFDHMVDRTNDAPWVIYGCMVGTHSIIQYIKLKKKSNLLLAILSLTATVLLLVLYVTGKLGG